MNPALGIYSGVGYGSVRKCGGFKMNNSLHSVSIGLLWHSMNSDNLGVGALSLAHIAILEELAKPLGVNPKFVVLGWTDCKPHYTKRDNIEVVGLRMKDFIQPIGGLLSKLRQCDLVFDIGAGDSFSDIYGAKRFGTIWASKVLCLLAGRPIVLAPQTIGPFDRPLNRRLAGAVIKRAAAVATRDDLSTQFLRSMKYEGRIIEASDVALRLPYHPTEQPVTDKIRVGLNVSGLLFNGGYNRDNTFGLRSDYAELIRTLIARLVARDDVDVHLVPHVIADDIPVEDDHHANLTLAKEFPTVRLAPKFHDPRDAKSYIAGMDFFAGARMHACIAALSSGVPVLPMAYSRKFAGLFGSMGYDLLADCRTESNEEITTKFEAALHNRRNWQVQAEVSLARGLERLRQYEMAVSDALQCFACR